MAFRKFTESIKDVSIERVTDIEKILSKMSAELLEKIDLLESLENELNNFKSDSSSKNDQIDDSVAYIQMMKSYMNNVIEQNKKVRENMDDYAQNGRRYIYTETR